MLQAYTYTKWDACGNTTLFFEKGTDISSAKIVRAQSQRELCAEQTAFVSAKDLTMRMAGGELCVNATRSFGAYLAHKAYQQGVREEKQKFTVNVSGWFRPVELTVKGGEGPEWNVLLTMKQRFCGVENLGRNGLILRIPGIRMQVIDEALAGRVEDTCTDIKARAMELIRERNMDEEPACGVVWCRKVDKIWHIRPVIYVKALDTLYEEQACGSASVAVALARWYYRENMEQIVQQPSGERLKVNLYFSKINNGPRMRIRVTGPVRLVSEGTWYA